MVCVYIIYIMHIYGRTVRADDVVCLTRSSSKSVAGQSLQTLVSVGPTAISVVVTQNSPSQNDPEPHLQSEADEEGLALKCMSTPDKDTREAVDDPD